MYTNFDEMDIEPKSEGFSLPSVNVGKNDESNDEEMEGKLLMNTVPLDDGSIGYVFTCTKMGPSATWRCHACNFVDTWKNLLRHIESKRHHDSMSKFEHPRANFSKVENAIPDITKGQPLPPGMEDVITGPCQILKTLENYDQPLIGLEFLLELNIIDLKEPRYLCLLCDKRGDPRSILVHLTSQSHYLWYLRKYFKKFFNLIDKLPKSIECRGNVSTVTSHLIAKLEEKYGRLQPTATREDVINSSEQRSILLQKIDGGVHFTQSPEDSYLEEMLTVEYVQNANLLVKNFPLKPKVTHTEEKADEFNSKSLFNKSTKTVNRKQLRNRDSSDPVHEESPEVLFVSSSSRKYPEGSRPRSRERSPRSRTHRSSRSRSPRRHSSRSRSRHRSRTPDYIRRKYQQAPSSRPPARWSRSRSRSPYSRRHRSRSPFDRYRQRSPHSRYPRPPGYRHRSPGYHRGRSPPHMKLSSYPPRPRGRSRSRSSGHGDRDRSPRHRSSHGPRPNTKNGSPRSSRPELHLTSGPHRDPFKDEDSSEKPDRASYLKASTELEDSMNRDMEKYTETPENHPAYQEEWKKFWCSRFKELQTEGKVNPHTYDYKPEWITFWNVRMKELFNEELTNRRNALKLKYNITNNEDLIPITPVSKEEDEVKSNPTIEDANKPVVNIKTMWKELTGFEIREEPARRKSPSPWEEDNDDSIKDKEASKSKSAGKNPVINLLDDACTQPISPEPLSSISDGESVEHNPAPRSRSRSASRSRSPRSRSRSHSRTRSRSRSKTRSYSKDRSLSTKEEYPFRKPSKKIHFDNPLNIITVLRQLSVLEFQLGSYASHVIKLLSSGLAMEKIKPQSSIDMLTTENIMFLELVKEKLKGQLLAGVVQKAMVKATLFCIKNIEELLLLAPKMKPVAPPPIPTPPPALIYGSVAETPNVTNVPTPSSGLPYGSHVYGGGHHGGRGKRFPYQRNTSNRRNNNEDFQRPQHDQNRPFADAAKNKPPPMQPPPVPQDDIVIDEKLIAVQIAEVLTAQGRTDVSEEELRTLINTVVENLKEEQRNRLSGKEKGVSREPVTTSALAAPVVSGTNSSDPEITSIPAGFNLNDVSNSTLAILQDAFDNASSNKAAAAAAAPIETLPEAEVIQLLRNFKSIPRMKQEKLIEYLRKLEDTDPERVEELKKYVNVR